MKKVMMIEMCIRDIHGRCRYRHAAGIPWDKRGGDGNGIFRGTAK